MGALATLGTLVDFVMFVESGARFAALIKMSETSRSGGQRETWGGEGERKKKKGLYSHVILAQDDASHLLSGQSELTLADLLKHRTFKNTSIFSPLQ